MSKNELFRLFKASFRDWQVNNDPLRSAALTFFIILPLPSILLIVEAIFALFYGQTRASDLLIQQITSFAGPSVAGLFKELLTSEMSPFKSIWGSVTFVAFSLGGAIGAFVVLRGTMDLIWEVKYKKKQPLASRVRQRIGPFVVVSALGLIVIGWTAAAGVLFKTIGFFSVTKSSATVSIAIAQVLSTFALSLLLFALTYKLIPDARVHWRDVAVPSLIASVAFTVTNYIIGTYVETFTVTTIIGAAGSLLIILLWIFITNQIMLFGAELSKVYATTHGEHAMEHLSPAAERIFRSIERAGERIEEAAKGEVEEESEETTKTEETGKPQEMPQAKAAGEKQAEPAQGAQIVPLKPIPPAEKEETLEQQESEEPSVEVRVTIRSKRKKKAGNSEG